MQHPPPPPLTEKSHSLFPSNPPLKAEVLPSSPFLKIWLGAQPPSLEKGEVHTIMVIA